MDDINLGLYLNHGCVHQASLLTMDCSGDLVFTVELLWKLFHKLLPPPPHPHPSASRPPTPLATLAQNWCALSKNNLKWPEIKQVTNSKLNYNKVNRLLSPVLQNIVGSTRAKAG